MDCDELLNGLIDNKSTDQPTDKDSNKKDRLSAIVAGGRSKTHLGKEITLTDIDSMSEADINKMYTRYEARLGASMTKTIGNTIISIYTRVVSSLFPVVDPPALLGDLSEDPFIDSALTNTCCELYYRYGMYLAPITTLLTTIKHLNYEEIFINKNGKSEDSNSCPSESTS
jgi:hypothetical protein